MTREIERGRERRGGERAGREKEKENENRVAKHDAYSLGDLTCKGHAYDWDLSKHISTVRDAAALARALRSLYMANENSFANKRHMLRRGGLCTSN